MQGTRGSLHNKLFLFSFLQGVANGIWGFLSIFILDIGGTGLEVGILATVPGLASTFMQMAWGRVSDRHDHNWRMISTGFLFTAILSVPVLFSNRPWHVIVATGVQALFSSIAGVAVVVRLAEILRPTRRARFMGVYNPMGFAGNIAGSFYSGIAIPAIGYRFTFLTYTLINLIIASLVSYGLRETDEMKLGLLPLMRESVLELKNGLREMPVVIERGGAYIRWCLGISVRGFGIAMFGPVLTVFIVQVLDASKPQIGALNALAFALRLLLSPILGLYVDRKGPKTFMLVGVLLAAMHPIALALVGDVSYLVPVFILDGLYWALINSSWFAWQMNLIPVERGVYAGFLNFVNGLSWAFGPLLGGYISDVTGLWVAASISAALVMIGFSILLKVPNQLEEQIAQI